MPLSTSRLAADFIVKLWRLQPTGTFGVLAVKDWDTGAWSNHPVSTRSPNPPNTANLNGATDLYFTPCLFSEPRARKEHACPSRILYADLDEVDPHTLDIAPTLAWETSPGHFQAAWLLDRPLKRQTFERLNQRLTYATGADRGGWSSTKVLRVPGSLSTKYEQPFRVRILRTLKPRRYTVETLRRLLQDIPTTLDAPGTLPPSDTLPDSAVTYTNRRKQIPVRGRQLLRTRSLVNGDDRSARLWELETLLVRAGLEAEEVYVLVKDSVWNKYKGQRREATQLWNEIAKAQANAAPPPSKEPEPAKPPKKRKYKREMVVVSDFRSRIYKTPTWLINQMWTRGAFGFLAGESKTYKSLLALDAAVSVSSGTSFLSHFQVPIASRGPVLLWQEENDEGLVQERLRRIEHARGLGYTAPDRYGMDLQGRDYPLVFGNRQAIDLGAEADLKYIRRQIHRYEPRLVIFDPLYMMTPTLDENEAAAMTPVLVNLKKIQDETKTSICVVHHYKKPQSGTGKKDRAMHRMSGTGVFGRRYDSAIWVEVLEEDESKPVIRVSSSHRAQTAGGAFVVSFDMPDDENMSYTAHVRPWTDQDDIEDEARVGIVLDHAKPRVAASNGEPPAITKRTELKEVAKALGVRSQTLQREYEQKGYSVVPGETYNGGSHRHLYVIPLERA